MFSDEYLMIGSPVCVENNTVTCVDFTQVSIQNSASGQALSSEDTMRTL
uniref:Uncharacterized protein n=1 Tax=Anguilla anguilla TaxID=7936 RepID=A0A0E9SAD2_ANGAN